MIFGAGPDLATRKRPDKVVRCLPDKMIRRLFQAAGFPSPSFHPLQTLAAASGYHFHFRHFTTNATKSASCIGFSFSHTACGMGGEKNSATS